MFRGSRRQGNVVRLCGVAFITVLVLSSLRVCAPEPDGAVLFSEHCASCHLDPLFPRAPHLEMMQGWNPEVIMTALSADIMEEQGRGLSAVERTAVADYISLGVVAMRFELSFAAAHQGRAERGSLERVTIC